MTLPDGSRVWLNAASSLKYPVAFNEKERVVELSGEGYFEVNASPRPSPGGEGDGKTPFIVKVDGMEVEVLGTHFNVNAYTDEAGITTTLLEGSVRVGSGMSEAGGQKSEVGSRKSEVRNENEVILNPGEQALSNNNGKLIVNRVVNTDEVVAWKNGQFKFENEPIESIMRQVARWYDATVVYKKKPNYHFKATIYRTEPLSKLLELLEMTNRVHFKIEGKTIVVSP